MECSSLTSLSIEEGESSIIIGSYAFGKCESLTSVSLSNNVKTIGSWAFWYCTSLTSITIPKNVDNIGSNCFYWCQNLKSVTFHCKNIGTWFNGISTIEEIIIGEEVTSIASGAFDGTAWANNQSDGLIYIGNFAYAFMGNMPADGHVVVDDGTIGLSQSLFKGNKELTSITLPNSIQTIGAFAFEDCSNLSSINIPKSLKSIGEKAFNGCTGLKKVIIPDIAAWCAVKFDKYGGEYNSSNPLLNAKHIYSDEDTEITNLVIPDGVTCIENMVFIGCEALTSINIPSSVTLIKEFAFMFCYGLTSVTLPEGVTDFTSAFWSCTNLESISLPNTLTRFDSNAFHNCPSLTNVNIPNSVTSIGKWTFSECSMIASLIFPDNITFIGNEAFNTATKLYCNDHTSTLLALWEAGYTPYKIGTETLLVPPSVSVVSTTQTTAIFKIENYQAGYIYTFNGKEIDGDKVELKDLFPETKTSAFVGMSVSGVDQVVKYLNFEYTTEPISPTINVKSTASSVDVSVSYIKGDAEVTSQRLVMNPSSVNERRISGGTDIESLTYSATGLNPSQLAASFAYEIVVSNGNYTKRYYTDKNNVYTASLTLTTQQPKVVSVGNVIIAADSNLDDEEENVGFEWRRTDWTNDFASNTGGAALFEGRMEGYIRNMNAEKLWKYRPYYLSNSGTYYYGEWVGIDPSNTSYFEPTVHTYEKTVIEGNTALVKGYALTGTDKITVQGFKYWRQASKARGVSPVSVPSDAMTIEASGQVMTASLIDLDYGATYNYLSFVTTSEGETFYGELKEFTTDEAEKIGDVNDDGKENAEDIVAITNYILGTAVDVTQEKADVNGDGVVDIADVIKLANIIMDK